MKKPLRLKHFVHWKETKTDFFYGTVDDPACGAELDGCDGYTERQQYMTLTVAEITCPDCQKIFGTEQAKFSFPWPRYAGSAAWMFNLFPRLLAGLSIFGLFKRYVDFPISTIMRDIYEFYSIPVHFAMTKLIDGLSFLTVILVGYPFPRIPEDALFLYLLGLLATVRTGRGLARENTFFRRSFSQPINAAVERWYPERLIKAVITYSIGGLYGAPKWRSILGFLCARVILEIIRIPHYLLMIFFLAFWPLHFIFATNNARLKITYQILYALIGFSIVFVFNVGLTFFFG